MNRMPRLQRVATHPTDRLRALLLVGCAVACVAAHAPTRASPPTDAAGPAAPCRDWVRVERGGVGRYVCGARAIAHEMRACPSVAVRAGDRVVFESGDRCPPGAEPLPAGIRVALGVALDVNTAGAGALQRIRGIGPATAAALVAARPYGAAADLERARGIGPKRRAALTEGPAPPLRLAPPPRLWPPSPSPDARAPR